MAQMKSVNPAKASNCAGTVAKPTAGQKRILLAHDHIDRDPDEDRRCEVEEFVEDRAEHGQPHCAMLAGGIVPKTDERMGLLVGGQGLIPKLGIGHRSLLF